MELLLGRVRNGDKPAAIFAEFPEMSNRKKCVLKTFYKRSREEEIPEERIVKTYGFYGPNATRKAAEAARSHGGKVFKVIYRKDFAFTGYDYEDVILFEDFEGQLSIGQMKQLLNWDGSKQDLLPAKWTMHMAAYTKVFVSSRFPLEEWYSVPKEASVEQIEGLKARFVSNIYCPTE